MNLPQLIHMGSLAIVGVINLLPLIGVVGGEQLSRGYGVDVTSPELELLLRHRALLFGLVGSLVLSSLWMPQLRVAAMLSAGVSMLGFLLLAWPGNAWGEEIQKIIWVDIAGVAALACAAVTQVMFRVLPHSH